MIRIKHEQRHQGARGGYEHDGDVDGEKEEGGEDESDVEVDGAEPEDEGDNGSDEGVVRAFEHRRFPGHLPVVLIHHFD